MPIVRLPEGSLRDEIRQPIYDTITIAAAESPVGVRRFFSNVQGKSLAQTNLRQNNLLETAVSFRVQGLCLDAQNFYAANVGCLPVIDENSSLSIKIGEKVYWQGPFIFASGRISAFASAMAAPFLYQKHGDVSVQPVILQGKHVVDINPLQSFEASWTCDNLTAAELVLATPAAATSLKYVMSLKGLLRRPVQ
jgi:hypothetical protein